MCESIFGMHLTANVNALTNSIPGMQVIVSGRAERITEKLWHQPRL